MRLANIYTRNIAHVSAWSQAKDYGFRRACQQDKFRNVQTGSSGSPYEFFRAQEHTQRLSASRITVCGKLVQRCRAANAVA
jgi:hypothetical protein